jgi:ethanolamine ammonia-lyase small subunit
MKEVIPHEQQGWDALRNFTAARIGLGRAGAGIPTEETLNFKLAHAKARDAVHTALEKERLLGELRELGLPVIPLHSRAMDRGIYLRRPDLGRRLDEASREILEKFAVSCDLALVIADGLSSQAIDRQAVPFLKAFLPLVRDLNVGPLTLVEQGRVAIADEVGELFRARLVVILIGERPGLVSPDSMGLYLTYEPKVGLTDERRNCISNVREEGLPPVAAAHKLAWLVRESLVRGLSGVELKDEGGSVLGEAAAGIEG